MSVFAAKIIVALVAVYLIGLGAVALANADTARKYLLAHAASPLAHYVELFIRFVSGWAILTMSPYMFAPGIFKIVGGVILLTTAVLLVLPWRVHSNFAKWSVPQAVRHIKVIAIGSLVGGVLMAYALLSSSAFEPANLLSGTAA